MVLGKTLESPLDCKEIQPVHSKEINPEYSLDAEAEAPVLWPPHAKSWLIRKDPDAGKDRRQEAKGTTEDEMAEWHHWLDGHQKMVKDLEAWLAAAQGVANSRTQLRTEQQ